MTFTSDHLRIISGWFAELEAMSLSSFPSEFGVITDNDDLNRVFRIEISDHLDIGVAFMRKYHTVGVIPDDFDPDNLPSEESWTVTDPMVDGETYEGTYRHVQLRTYRQKEDGAEYFYVVQTLSKHFEKTADITDLTKFHLATSDYYHADHAQPVLVLENVAPESVHEICESINQDTYTDIEYDDGVLEGTWYRIRIRSEVQDDGTYHIFLLLADSVNSELYYYYRATQSIIRGYYYKWETTEAAIDTFLSSTKFEADGTIDEDGDSGTSSTLRESVTGRSVALRRGVRDEDDRLFDWEIEITWTVSTTITPTGDFFLRYGEPLEKISFVRHCAGEPLPTEQDLLGYYAAVKWNSETGEFDTVDPDDYDSEDATHLTGRRLIRTLTKNEQVVDGVLYYDLYQVELTAPLDEDDEWFYAGGAKTPERSIRTAYSGFTDSFGDSFPPGTWTGVGMSNYVSRFFCEYRTKTTTRNVKFFYRRPTEHDLLRAGSIESIVDDASSNAVTETAVEIMRIGNLYAAIKMVTITSDWSSDASNAPSWDHTVGSEWSDGYRAAKNNLPSYD